MTTCFWLEDLCFDILDQKYELGKKICSTTFSFDAAIRRLSSWLHDGEDDDARESRNLDP